MSRAGALRTWGETRGEKGEAGGFGRRLGVVESGGGGGFAV